MIKCLLSRPGLIAGPLHSTPLQIISQSIPRLDPINSKSSSFCNNPCTFLLVKFPKACHWWHCQPSQLMRTLRNACYVGSSIYSYLLIWSGSQILYKHKNMEILYTFYEKVPDSRLQLSFIWDSLFSTFRWLIFLLKVTIQSVNWKYCPVTIFDKLYVN